MQAANCPSLGKKLGLLAAGLIVGIGAAELLLRAAGVSYPQPYEPDVYCGTRLKPGFQGWWRKEGSAWIQVNQHGFRHGDRGPAKPPGTFRVAVLGDSFVEAFQVDQAETFCGVLERKLAASPALAGRPVEVLNFGVSGFGTAQQLQMLRHYVWPYQPDLVLLAFFPGNDVCNNSADLEPYQVRPFFRLREGELQLDDTFRQHPDYIKAGSAAVRCKVALINRSRLLQLIQELRRGRPPVAAAAGPGIDEAAWIEPPDDRWQQAWELSERLVLEIRDEVQRRGADFLLLVIGSPERVHPDPAVPAAVGQRLGVDDLAYAERRLSELGRRHSFPVLTLAEPMSRHAREHQEYLHGFANTAWGVGHWNAAGHRLAAELTAREILESAGIAAEESPPEDPRRLPARVFRLPGHDKHRGFGRRSADDSPSPPDSRHHRCCGPVHLLRWAVSPGPSRGAHAPSPAQHSASEQSSMDKKDLSERDICTKYITPAVKRAGWDELTQIREEVSFTALKRPCQNRPAQSSSALASRAIRSATLPMNRVLSASVQNLIVPGGGGLWSGGPRGQVPQG